LDKGKSWTAISNNLPERGSVYAIEEDHVDSELIFCGTEFGVFFSPDAGKRWKKLANGLPTIAVRDIAIQERENDLVLGTFGRGFYVLDDYSALRSIENNNQPLAVTIYPIRDALVWEKSNPLGLPGKSFQGDNFYSADNLGPEAIITFYYNEKYKSLEEQRREKEKDLIKEGKGTPYPSYEDLKAEKEEQKPQLFFTIKDNSGTIVKKVTQKITKGLQRFHWDMRYNNRNPIDLKKPSFYNPFAGKPEGSLVNPGRYTVEMHLLKNGTLQSLIDPVAFNVIPLNNTVMPAENRAEKVAFQKEVAALSADIRTSRKMIDEMNNKLRYIKKAVRLAESSTLDLTKAVFQLESDIKAVNKLFFGDPVKRRLDIDQPPGPASRVGDIVYEQKYSTAAPTKTHRESFAIAKEEFEPIKEKVRKLYKEDMANLEKILEQTGAPYTPGRVLNNRNE